MENKKHQSLTSTANSNSAITEPATELLIIADWEQLHDLGDIREEWKKL